MSKILNCEEIEDNVSGKFIGDKKMFSLTYRALNDCDIKDTIGNLMDRVQSNALELHLDLRGAMFSRESPVGTPIYPYDSFKYVVDDCFEPAILYKVDHLLSSASDANNMSTVVDIPPGRFMLACTVEKLTMQPTCSAMIMGKSTLARCGLSIHQTGGWIDPEFRGSIVLEIYNSSSIPIVLAHGMPICQMIFFKTKNTGRGYSSQGHHYQDQSGPTLPYCFKP